MIDFCHITPIPHLDFVKGRDVHLVLAHLIERDAQYRDFYRREKDEGATIIMDNSAFEIVKHQVNNGAYYSVEQLIELGRKVKADYVVMTDYPARDAEITIKEAEYQAPILRDAGFGTFFVPQSKMPYTTNEIHRTLRELSDSFIWALQSELIDYIAFSILSIPNVYGVEKDNRLQRYLSRYQYLQHLCDYVRTTTGKTLNQLKQGNDKKFHFLGMVDGPNEIALIRTLESQIGIDTWDSSSAVWAGLNKISYDLSPTGLHNGKYEREVDFNYYTPYNHELVRSNMEYIDDLCRV